MKIKIDYRPYEILVYLPYSQRARAKNIQGYRWDPKRKAWVYPREDYVALGLMQEFSPDETEITQTNRNTSESPWDLHPDQLEESLKSPEEALDIVISLMQENLGLSKKLAQVAEEEIRTHERLASLSESVTRVQELAEDLLGFKERVISLAEKLGPTFESDDELLDFLDMRLALDSGPYDLMARTAVAEAKASALLQENAELRSALGENTCFSDLDIARKLVAPLTKAWADSEETLAVFSLDGKGTMALQNHLDKILRSRLRKSTSDRSNFNQLIREAVDAQMLTVEGSKYCHFVRVQRNLFAHEHVPEQEIPVRATLALMGYALLAQELGAAEL